MGPEAELERMQRVMASFVEQLQAAGVVVPSNLQRTGACREVQHSSCYVYRFGTKRLHVSLREAAAGRLCLVVRCGGGFVDFADFCRKHGAVEQLKLNRATARGGVVQLNSVLSNNRVRLQSRGNASSGRLASSRSG